MEVVKKKQDSKTDKRILKNLLEEDEDDDIFQDD
jgi:hypothetical protein